MSVIFMVLPAIVLIASIAYVKHAVKNGVSRKKAMITQFVVIAAVCALCIAVPSVAFAASTGNAGTAAAAAQTADPSKGMSMMAVAIVSAVASIGGAAAVAASAPAAIGATGENPKVFGQALIFVALGEGIAIYGLLLAILMLQKV